MAYKWHLVLGRDAQEQIDQLARKDRMLIFEKIKDLLNADNPSDPDKVTDIKELSEDRYAGLWRKRAGNWRILYRIEVGAIVFEKFEYKGRLLVVTILNRRDL